MRDSLYSEKYKRAYSEIMYILNSMNEKYIKKIPDELLTFFERSKDNNYKVNIDPKISLYQNDLEPYTLEILNVLNLNFWCEDNNERREIISFLENRPVEFVLNSHLQEYYGEENNFLREILEKNEEEKAKEIEKNNYYAEIQKENLRKESTKEEKTSGFFAKIKKWLNED